MMDVGRVIVMLPIPAAVALLALVVAAASRRRGRRGRRARRREAFFQFHRPAGGHFGQGEERL